MAYILTRHVYMGARCVECSSQGHKTKEKALGCATRRNRRLTRTGKTIKTEGLRVVHLGTGEEVQLLWDGARFLP